MSALKKPQAEWLLSKLGTAKGAPRSRIWIEGPRLTRAGFNPGDKFHVDQTEAKGSLILRRFSVESVGVPVRKVGGKGSKPIIDITGAQVRDVFPHFTHVVCEFTPNYIEIRGAADFSGEGA